MESDFFIRIDTIQQAYMIRKPREEAAALLEVAIFQEFRIDDKPDQKIGHLKVVKLRSTDLAESDLPIDDLWDTPFDPITSRFYIDPYTGRWDEELEDYNLNACFFIVEFVLIPKFRSRGLGLKILKSWLKKQDYEHAAGLLLPTQFDPDFETPDAYIDLQLYQYSQDKEASKQKLADHFSKLGFSRWVAHEERPGNKKLRHPEEEIEEPDDFDFLTVTNFTKLESFRD